MIGPALEPFDFPAEYDCEISDNDLRCAIHAAFGGRCFYTRQEVSLDEMHVDHVIPKAQGGPDNIFNYVLTGPATNIRKGGKVDPVAVAGPLYLVRTHFAPRVIRLLKTMRQSRRSKAPKRRRRSQEELAVERERRRREDKLGLVRQSRAAFAALKDVAPELEANTFWFGPSPLWPNSWDWYIDQDPLVGEDPNHEAILRQSKRIMAGFTYGGYGLTYRQISNIVSSCGAGAVYRRLEDGQPLGHYMCVKGGMLDLAWTDEIPDLHEVRDYLRALFSRLQEKTVGRMLLFPNVLRIDGRDLYFD